MLIEGNLAPEVTLGHGSIDTDHREALMLFKAAQAADDSQFADHLAALSKHLIDHFDREERLMLDSGDRNLAEHRAEHGRALAELARFVGQAQRGRIVFARAWLNDMFPDWLKRHIVNMDSAAVANLPRA
ncbi:MAG: hemerythrin family protein [Hyphomicrobiaceae bacterium]|nr:hemerythrin family protein [Hyphomicrobiaceae bacterium]